MSNAAMPTTNGSENKFIAITAAIMSMKAQKRAAGGPRRYPTRGEVDVRILRLHL